MLLENPVLRTWRAVTQSESAARILRQSPEGLKPVDEVLLLQEIPLFAQAGARQLLEVARIARRVSLGAGERVFGEGEVSAICVVLSGRLALCRPDEGEPACAEPGDMFGMYETLVGRPTGWRGEALEPGMALRIDREDLFDLLADQIDLLRGLFSVMCTRPLSRPQPVSSMVTQSGSARVVR